jgi:hypothetical protein
VGLLAHLRERSQTLLRKVRKIPKIRPRITPSVLRGRGYHQTLPGTSGGASVFSPHRLHLSFLRLSFLT